MQQEQFIECFHYGAHPYSTSAYDFRFRALLNFGDACNHWLIRLVLRKGNSDSVEIATVQMSEEQLIRIVHVLHALPVDVRARRFRRSLHVLQSPWLVRVDLS